MNSRLAIILAALALALAGPAVASDRCTELATLAAAIAEHKAAGIEQAAVASQLRAQYRDETEDQRNAIAMTEQVLKVVYRTDKAPEWWREEARKRCKAGEFDQKKP